MTVSTTESQIDYTGNGATVFAIPFLFLANGDLVLTKMDANDAVTTLVLGSDYTLSGAGNPSGGAATLTAPLTTGNRLRIARSMIAVQETDLRNQGKFYQQTIEDAFDYVTLLIQQYRTAIANSMQKSIGGLFWDALGLVIRNVGAPVKANDATTKSYVDTNIANTGSASIAYTDAAIAKTVRAPENLAPLAAAGTRANRLMGFDSLGNPVAVVPGSGPVNDASAVLWSRSPLDQAIASVHQGLDASDISPWEYAGLVTSRPTPSDPRTWDWTPAIQAAINEAWGYSPGGAVFNNAISASMRSVNLGGMTYGIGSTVSLPSGGGSGGAGGAFRICNGGLVALAGFAAGTAMLRASSLDANDWTQNVYIENIEFDGARNADRCIEVQKSVGTYIDKCHITRYNDRGVTTSNSAFNVLVTRCYIEAFPFGTGTEATQRAQAPEAGIYFNSADCAAFNNTIIGNIRGIRVANRSRIAGNHLYGNKYAIDVALQYATVVGNYLEDPIITSVSFADCAIEANFFSDSIRGGCLLSPDDGAGQLRGANIGDNPFSRRTLTATGNLTLSGTSGLITITSSAADFDNFVTTGHCPDGAVIAAGGAYAVVIDDASNSTTSVKARAVGTFSGTSFATGSWTQNVSFIALIETTFGASSALNVSGSANIRHTGTSVNQSTTTRSFFNNGGTIGIPSRSLYDWGQGDGRGDFWVGNTSPTKPQGLAFGVLTTSANAGSAAIWSYGTLEQVAVGGRTAGQYALFTATDLRPGADNTRSCGTSSRRWSTVYAGTGTINTSDAREKTDVRVMADAEIAAAKQLASEIGVYQFLDSVRAKGADARSHVGMTVQRAIEVMESHGLNPFGYGFICYDSWPDREAILDDDGSVIDPAQIAGDRYSFRDNELAYFILSGLQARQADLEERLTSLESK